MKIIVISLNQSYVREEKDDVVTLNAFMNLQTEKQNTTKNSDQLPQKIEQNNLILQNQIIKEESLLKKNTYPINDKYQAKIIKHKGSLQDQSKSTNNEKN